MHPAEALQRLKEGNRRFASGSDIRQGAMAMDRRQELAGAQSPFAAILGCSDSRVPPEVVFDQGPGDLFVVRVAGNIATLAQIGSVEFAVEVLGARLVVVLGHTRCGAVEAALQSLKDPGAVNTPGLGSIVERIRPVVALIRAEDPPPEREILLQRAVRANIHASADDLVVGSPILSRRLQQGALQVVQAEYDLETGVVDFLADSPGIRGGANI